MSEENRGGLVKSGETRLPKFVEDAYESIEKMQGFAQILLDSRLVPNHFYEKLPGDKNKPNFEKGKVPAVVAVLIQGYQLDIPPMTALQHIVPVNGLLSIKGDLAKSMIFSSGLLKQGSWKEEEFGSIEDDNLVVKITATRGDNGQTITRSFSIDQAKRAGLWVTEAQANGNDGWKYKSSAWWKYPSRMINYRALGFLARDMFPDVLAGIYTTEEAQDMPIDEAVIIEGANGATLEIQDKGHAAARSKKITKSAVGKIEDKHFTPVQEEKPVEEVVEKEEKFVELTETELSIIKDRLPVRIEGEPAEHFVKRYNDEVDVLIKEFPGALLIQIKPEEEPKEGDLSIEKMMSMETEFLLAIINANADMIEAMMLIPGKNTNKKLREIIFAHQEGKLSEHCEPYKGESQGATGEDPINEQNTNFDKQGSPGPITEKEEKLIEANAYDMDVPAFDKGEERDFATVKDLFTAMLGIAPRLDNEKFLELVKNIPEFEKYANKEDFCKYATIEEVNRLLNENSLPL